MRLFRRVQAGWLAAKGITSVEIAEITALGLRSVYRLARRYLRSHRVEDLVDMPRAGRPPEAPGLTAFPNSARTAAFAPQGWAIGPMSGRWRRWLDRLNRRYGCCIGPRALASEG